MFSPAVVLRSTLQMHLRHLAARLLVRFTASVLHHHTAELPSCLSGVYFERR